MDFTVKEAVVATAVALQEAIEVTARALFDRSGPNAVDEALKQAMYLKKSGDKAGCYVWIEIAKVMSGYSLEQTGKDLG